MIASLVALAALGATPRRAMATSCALPRLGGPKPDQTNVPLDTKLWYGYQFLDDPVTLRLVGPDGEVPLQTVIVHVPRALDALVATPQRELEPSTTYSLEATCARSSCGGTIRFTTGTGRATKPALPVVLRQEPYAREGPGGGERAVVFEFEPQDFLVLADVAGATPFRTDQPESALTGPWGVDRVWVGEKICNVPEAPFPFDPSGRRTDTAPVRFGRIDLAGNFSGWTEARSVTLPPAAGGCSASERPRGGPSLGVVTFAMLAAATRRRRARP